jgi:HD-GYP domain-containing protein (c-di-GMP phosphodiesterase class II)
MVALEARDCYTLQHCVNVAFLARRFGEFVGASQAILDAITSVGELHDVGKIGIGDAILNKKGPLTEAEYETMKFHPQIGLEIIDPLGTFPDEGSLVSAHHERWDGSGYPLCLEGDDIPLIARITAITDVFDACTTTRPYRKAMPITDGLRIIEQSGGKGFDPELTKEFLRFFVREFGPTGDEYAQAIAELRASENGQPIPVPQSEA